MERREKCFRSLTFVLFVIFSLWFFLQFLAPLALSENSVQDLSGLVAISDNAEIIDNMDFPWSLIYSTGDRLCHQRAERSFVINGNYMPFCSRCTAIFFGIVIGLGFMVFYRIQLNEKFLFVIIAGVIPLALDGGGQLFGFWESTNAVRVITGTITGIVCGLAIGIIFDEIKSINFFKNTKSN